MVVVVVVLLLLLLLLLLLEGMGSWATVPGLKTLPNSWDVCAGLLCVVYGVRIRSVNK